MEDELTPNTSVLIVGVRLKPYLCGHVYYDSDGEEVEDISYPRKCTKCHVASQTTPKKKGSKSKKKKRQKSPTQSNQKKGKKEESKSDDESGVLKKSDKK